MRDRKGETEWSTQRKTDREIRSFVKFIFLDAKTESEVKMQHLNILSHYMNLTKV